MELGCFLTPYYPGDRSPQTNADELLARATTCADAGYEYAQVGDHHVTHDGQFFQNLPTAGRLSARFDRVAALFLLPLYEPVFVAEYLGTLGALTDELEFWCAVGGNEEAFDAVGVSMADRAGRFEEALDVVERLLAGETVSYAGDHFTTTDVAVAPTAAPRLCLGGGARPAVERAGRRGDAWVAHPTETVADIERKADWLPDDLDIIARRDALVLDDDERATARAGDLLEEGYRGWPIDADWPLVGDPQSVAGELSRLEAVGVSEVVVGAMDHEVAATTFQGVARARSLL